VRQTSTGTGGGTIRKWADLPGTKIEGVFMKLRQGQQNYTPLASIKTETGIIDVPAPYKLRELLEPVQPGAYVWITHTGKIQLKGGKTMNTFEVDYDNDYAKGAPAPLAQSVAAGPAAPTSAPASEYDVLLAKLSVANPKGAAAIASALVQMYPDEAVRLQKLQETLKQQGVAV
jgi:hypothetical protein